MGIVHIDSVKQGMVLSEDVKDISSRLLLSKGRPIHQNHIRIFKIWGVTEVVVDGAPEDDATADPNAPVVDNAVATQQTNAIFRNVDTDNPLMTELIRIAIGYRSRIQHAPIVQCKGGIGIHDLSAAPIRSEIITTLKSSKTQLPELPTLVSELNAIVNDPHASAEAIAQVVNKSPSLAALLLKIVNSAFYGFSTKIDSISRAVTLIGVKEITTLAIGVSALRLFKDIPRDLVDVASFFKHSFACGLIARMLAAHKNIQPPEQLFVAGLLHDIGRLILLKHFSDRYSELLRVAASSESSLYILEKAQLGCRHTDVAKYLIEAWKLPPSLADTIYYHHRPSSARDAKRAAVVHLADMIAHGLGLGSSGENAVPRYDADAVKQLDILPSNLELIVRQAVHQLVFLDSMFQEAALQ